jgi:organic radical activating enzyme
MVKKRIALNVQPVEPPRAQNDPLEVIKIWTTIQGEGPLVGMPAVFVRMAGCNLKCPQCDTDYTSNRQYFDANGLIKAVQAEIRRNLFSQRHLVVFTGGEPFRQYLTPVAFDLTALGIHVQIETNGTFFLQDFPYQEATIVCSPKTAKIHPSLFHFTDAWKYIIEEGGVDPDDGLPTRVLGANVRVARPPEVTHKTRIYVQPMDDRKDPKRNKAHMDTAVKVAVKYGYILSLQTHKYMGLE